MICRLCNEIFYLRRGLLDLFNTKEEYVCNKCYKKYPIHISFEAIQLDTYTAIILSMFDKKYYIDFNVFIEEYNKVYLANMKRNGYYLFFFNHLELDDDILEALDAISKLVKRNIIVLCLSLKK